MNFYVLLLKGRIMMFLELHDVIKLYKPENEILQVPALRGGRFNLEEIGTGSYN